MAFSIGQRVTCERLPGRVGVVVALKKLRGLALVAWNRNFRAWIDEESLEAAR